eukprot:6204702-Pleurochrysis_carterae.AAC.1
MQLIKLGLSFHFIRLHGKDEGRPAASMKVSRPSPATALATAPVCPRGVPSQRIYYLMFAPARSCS